MSAREPFPRLPYVLLGAMSLVTFGGPFVLLLVVRGGESARWPPDRAVEWFAIALIFGLAIGLFSACVSIGWWFRPEGPGEGHKRFDAKS